MNIYHRSGIVENGQIFTWDIYPNLRGPDPGLRRHAGPQLRIAAVILVPPQLNLSAGSPHPERDIPGLATWS
jgi:hypothetical protein